ncbi:MJ1477/TM1410 family putative glycoside hydrolase [Pseudogemmobacter sp. W21_MBD1_M6]|uniref:MJ1477/TM1410 family putative glycoside hydrolase n=1 Tax=Pseudogemmobacter sp. W21_MBD1_M6 TaxID=3240271 RepID=UPI003F973DD1
MTLPFLYQLQNANYKSLSASDFNVAVIDMDDASLTASQIDTLQQDQGKVLITYVSIGEAENYRDYWQDGNWSANAPSFLLGENPDWEGNYLVKFWDTEWQSTIFARVDEALTLGYNGIYLDIVDAYDVAQVKNAYPGTDAELRQEMIDFVIALSDYAKAQDPNFLVVPQNAVGLLSVNENNPDSGPNTPYLDAIDGLGVEDLWYNGNNTSGWTSGDLEYIQNALNADKFVLATSYPTQDAKQETFIAKAIDAGLIPFVADRDLTGTIDPSNASIEAAMAGHGINTPWDLSASGSTPQSDGTQANDTLDTPPADIPPVETAPVDTAPVESVPDNTPPAVDTQPEETPTPPASTDSPVVDNTPLPQPVEVTAIYPSSTDAPTDFGSAFVTYGDGGKNWLTGNRGADILAGLDGNDTVKGGRGADIILGGNGNDKLRGQGGDDILYGENGRDRLFGGNGDDHLYGGADNDRLYGNAGKDVFHFGAGDGHDTIMDFEADIDTIVLHNIGASDPFSYADQVGSDVVFSFDGGDMLTIENTTIALLHDDLFIG